MPHSHEGHIFRSWETNAEAWTHEVRHNNIESRKLVTNQAIIDAVLCCHPSRVLDLGCGEGWLTRSLIDRQIDTFGIDASPQLIDYANRASSDRYAAISYEELFKKEAIDKYDTVVCNFSLLGQESVELVFRNIRKILATNGTFIIQTIHPVVGCGSEQYVDGWRAGSWDGFSPTLTDPAPWYFRTLESWFRLFSSNQLDLVDFQEPLNPITNMPASVVFIARAADEDSLLVNDG